MGISKNLLGVVALSVLLLPPALSAQCPATTEVDSILALQSKPAILSMIRQLSACADAEVKAYALHYAAGKFFKEVDLDQAIALSREALALREAMAEPPYKEIGKTCYNLGLFYQEKADLSEAEHFLSKAEQHFQSEKFAYGVAMARKNLASVFESKGDFDKAREYLTSTIQMAREAELKAIEADAQVDLGIILAFLKEPEAGLKALQQAAGIYQELEQQELRYNPVNRAACFLNIAYAHDEMKEWNSALKFYEQAQQLYDELDRPEMSITCQVNIGYTFFQQTNYTKASDYWHRALDQAVQQGFPELEAMCLDNLGDLQLEQDRCLEAVAYYDRAIDILLPGLTAKEHGKAVRSASNKEHLLNYLTDRGKALFACFKHTGEQRYLQQALKNYHQADELIDWMRYEHSARGSKLYWRAMTRPMFEQALEVCFELQDLEQSFYFMEKSKAILLLDAMRAHQARALIPEEMEQQESLLQKELAALRLEQLHAPQEEKEQWVDTILQVQQRLDQLVAQIKAANPVYAVMRYGGGVLGTGGLYERFVAPEQAGVAQYFMGSSQVYIWTMRPDGSMQFLRKEADVVRSHLEHYFLAMDKLSKAFYPDQYAIAAFRLYEDLFALVDAFQDGSRMLIVPDGEIALLPFEALMRSAEFDAGQYLVQHLEIQYAYSMAVLNQQQHTQTKGRAVYTFAPLFENGERGLPALTQSHRLLDSYRIRKHHKLEGIQATATELDAISEAAYVINLITHAVAEQGAVPRIELADRALYLPELYARHIPANLVLLGACQTGIGELSKGEGVMSLASGFAYAGVASLIGSLWKVREDAAADLLSRFYANTLSGEHKSAALWNAKRQYLAQADKVHVNPYYWAAFVYVGADGPLELEQRIPWWYWSLLPVAGVLLWVLLQRRKRRIPRSVAIVTPHVVNPPEERMAVLHPKEL